MIVLPSCRLQFQGRRCGMAWTVSDGWSVLSGYVPYGPGPTGLTLGSEFGASPPAAFVQVRMYR